MNGLVFVPPGNQRFPDVASETIKVDAVPKQKIWAPLTDSVGAVSAFSSVIVMSKPLSEPRITGD